MKSHKGERWIWDDRRQKLVTASQYHGDRENTKRSRLPSPMVIMDTMEPVQSQLDGKPYTSKAALRATYRAAGVIEIGNEKQKEKVRHFGDKAGIKTSLEKAFARVERGEMTEATKRRKGL